ncbi:MAG: hypothetical protein OHK005_09060 [Candidatus Methylacidiphilales bacterium]
MHNIAEGFDGGSNAEFFKFLRYAQRSASEVQSQLYVALDEGYISEDPFREIYSKAALARSKIGGSSPTSSAPSVSNQAPRTNNKPPRT